MPIGSSPIYRGSEQQPLGNSSLLGKGPPLNNTVTKDSGISLKYPKFTKD